MFTMDRHEETIGKRTAQAMIRLKITGSLWTKIHYSRVNYICVVEVMLAELLEF